MNSGTTDVMIGVDVGTTAVKVAAFGVNGTRVTGRLPTPDQESE
jgi:hypothetical protein